MKVFTEEQKMTKPLIFFALSIVLIGLCISIFNNLASGQENNTDDLIASLIGLFILFLIAFLIFRVKLKTRIDEKGISYQFFPFHFSYRLIFWNNISSCYVRKYNAIMEYGGWGFRTGLLRKKGKAYNVKGNMGLQLELKNGKKILIGTQKMEEIERVLENYKSKLTN